MATAGSEFVSRQNAHNEQIDARLAEFTMKTENRISTLRLELGAEFAKGDAKVTEINEKMAQFDLDFEDKKIALTLEISASFGECGSKCTEMRTLIEQSGTVLETSKQIINGAILAVNARIDTMIMNLQSTFQEIHAKHATYDSVIKARGAGGKGGKGGSGSGPFERMSYAEGRGLLHEKDIRMPMLADRFDQVETFRR